MVPEEISMKRMAQVKTRHRGDTKDLMMNLTDAALIIALILNESKKDWHRR